MNKRLQDIAWACLPKEARDKMRKDVAVHLDTDYYRGWQKALINYFGSHNLASNTDPEEMLIKSRAKIIDLYAKAENEVSFGSENLQLWGKHCMEILDALFGDKCLPDR